MTQTDVTPGISRKKSKLPLLLGFVAAPILAAGGFYATFSGMLLGPQDHAEASIAALPNMIFVPIDPIMISLGPGASARHLRFAAQLEVAGTQADDVKLLLPRIVDVLNGYLRAVELVQLEDPSALIRLKAQMLRRIQIVTGEGRVRDLLISEFVLN